MHRLLLLLIPVAFISLAILGSHATARVSRLLYWTQKLSRILWYKNDTKIYFIQAKRFKAKTKGKICLGGVGGRLPKQQIRDFRNE